MDSKMVIAILALQFNDRIYKCIYIFFEINIKYICEADMWVCLCVYIRRIA